MNQLRQKIGVVYGNPETTTGGNALKFYASVRLDIRKIGVLKNGDEVIGSKTRVKVVKNKVAPPFREAEFEILYGIGVNKLGEIVDIGEKAGLIDRSGNWYSYKGEKMAQGRDKVIAYLAENGNVAQEIRHTLVEGAKAECQMAPAAATLPAPALPTMAGAHAQA